MVMEIGLEIRVVSMEITYGRYINDKSITN